MPAPQLGSHGRHFKIFEVDDPLICAACTESKHGLLEDFNPLAPLAAGTSLLPPATVLGAVPCSSTAAKLQVSRTSTPSEAAQQGSGESHGGRADQILQGGLSSGAAAGQAAAGCRLDRSQRLVQCSVRRCVCAVHRAFTDLFDRHG